MGHTSYVVGVAWSPDGKTIASSSFDHTIRTWNAETGKEIATLEGHTGPVGCISYSVDGKLLASKSIDGTIRIWRSDKWETISIIPDSSFALRAEGLLSIVCPISDGSEVSNDPRICRSMSRIDAESKKIR